MIVNLTADAAVAVSKSDTVPDPAGPFIGLFVLTAGTVNWIDASGNTSGASDSLSAGTVIPIKINQVKSAGTTATVLGLKGQI